MHKLVWNVYLLQNFMLYMINIYNKYLLIKKKKTGDTGEMAQQ